MSMHFSVYVGPYLLCEKDSPREVPEKLWLIADENLTELRGELSVDDQKKGILFDYWGPNKKMTGVERALRYGGYSWGKTEAECEINTENEVAAFHSRFADDIQALKPFYKSVKVVWGIVPYFG